MAAKKTATKKKSTTSEPTKAKKVTPKTTAKSTTKAESSTKKSSANNGVAKPKATKPKATKPEAAKPAAEAKTVAAKPVAKKAAPIKLNDRQVEFLKKIQEAGVPGYKTGQKVELRTIEALVDRKLVKRGPKDKESGHYHYQASKAGEKFLASQQGS